ncbi:MAG: hypothetical protein AAF547_16795 [Actinomycetota bacterium]
MSDQFFWYVTRSSALVSWLGAALAILTGLITSSRLLGRRPTIPWLVDLHRGFAGLSVVFLGIHLLSLYLDGFVQFGLAELFVPWVATVPGLSRASIAYGVIAFWLIVVVQASSLVRDRLPAEVWRTLHLLSFGSLGFGSLHAIQTGSDIDNPIVIAIAASTMTAIALAAAVRVIRLRTGRTRQVAPQPAAPRPAAPRPVAAPAAPRPAPRPAPPRPMHRQQR